MYNGNNTVFSEVEALVERFTDRALEDFPALANHRSSLVQRTVKALEMESSWIKLYNITGRLETPPILDLEPELESVVLKLKRVPS
jgi:hypothetical protein